MSCGDIGVMSETNEWNLLKRQFDELTRDDSAGSDSIELDADFHHRFAELMNRVCGPLAVLSESQPVPAQFRRWDAQKLPSLNPISDPICAT